MKLHEKILFLRKSRGMTQEELADHLDISRQAVSRWESGTAMPDAGNVVQLAKLFAVTTDYLLREDYENEVDAPREQEVPREDPQMALTVLTGLEVMAVLLQGVSAFLLQNPVFTVLAMLPFVAVVTGFELGWRKRADRADEKARACRVRFYQITVWLGLYFPIRLVMTFLLRLWPRPYSALLKEAGIVAVYLCLAALLSWRIGKGK